MTYAEPKLHENGDIDMPVWVKRGPMMVNREALDADDPDRPENIIRGWGLDPADYGYNPLPPRPAKQNLCENCGEYIRP